MINTLIITGGSIQRDFALSFIKKLQPDHIIAIDKGLAFCSREQITPEYIAGDFDSLSPEILEHYKKEKKIPIREYNPVKDATDTCIGLEKAMEMGSTQIWLLGATGTRLDHVLCNIHILKRCRMKKIPAFIVDEHNLITLPVENEFTLKKSMQFGKYVSFFPLGEEVESLTLEGFKYPLKEYRLVNMEGLGVSNEICEETAKVKYEGGLLLMIQSRD